MLATKTQNLGDLSKWIAGDGALQAINSAAEDPVLGGITTKAEPKSNKMRNVKSIKLTDELKLLVDEMCK